METRVVALFCPNCGAPLSPDAGSSSLRCGYCNGVLLLQGPRVTYRGTAAASSGGAEQGERYSPPDATLSSTATKRFELSLLEQKVEGTLPDVFLPLELAEDRFALVSMRPTDDQGKTAAAQLESAQDALEASLEEDEDPGLAASHALEALLETGFRGKLEVLVALFDPKRAKVTVYNAGCRDSVYWVSQEEGRTIDAFRGHPALERKMLREAQEHFKSSPPVFLAQEDLVVILSAAYAGRGGGPYASGAGPLLHALNEHLGEEPLRVVTLAKNAFWEKRSRAEQGKAPSGDIRVAAVRARSPALPAKLEGGGEPRTFSTGRFSIALYAGARDQTELVPLFGQRSALLWLSPDPQQPMPDAATFGRAFEQARAAVITVLGREGHGDNENPRLAGRHALAAAAIPGVRICLVQLFDEWERVKHFRAGFKQPVALGSHGPREPASMQQFDEGGESTVHPGQRLFFPGAQAYAGEVTNMEQLAQVWPGGKASRLYQALFFHWRTKKTERALDLLARAAQADGAAGVVGMLLMDCREG